MPEPKAKKLETIESVNRLLILLLMKLGSDSIEIGKVLDVDSSVIRRIIATNAVKRLKLGGKEEK